MNLLDLLALTAIVTAATPFARRSVTDHYDREAQGLAAHAGFYHFPRSRTCPEGYELDATSREHDR